MGRIPITVVEVAPFAARAAEVWSEADLSEFISFIANNPEAGDIIVGSGGIRKVRWNRPGMGKRGGVRVIYYFFDESMPLFLLTVYPKTRKDNLDRSEVKELRRLASVLRSAYGKD